MPSPQTLLPWLLGAAIGAAGIFQGLHWRSSHAGADLSGLEDQLRIAGEENEMLKRENESLRSLAQGGGELAVPQELIDRAEKEFGMRYLSTPVVHQIAGEELRDRITAAIESKYGPAGIDDRQESYKYLGWLREGDDLLAQLAAVRSVGALGWFDDSSGEAWVTDRFEIQNIPDQAVLVRLLTRVLLHQHFPPPPSYTGDDEARAREALHHGAAAGAETRFLAANARVIGFMPMKQNPEAEQLMASLSTFLRGIVAFPATEGKGLADTLHVQGDETFQAAFRNPPRTTRGIMHPAESRMEPLALDLPTTPEEPFLTETAGQLGLRLWLAPLNADPVASSWKNDRYVLFPDGEQSVAVLWDIEMSTSAAADQLEAEALKYVRTLAGSDTAGTLGTPISAQGNRYVAVARPSATRVRFINAHESATVTELIGK